MAEYSIIAENIGKEFFLGENTARDRMRQALRAVTPRFLAPKVEGTASHEREGTVSIDHHVQFIRLDPDRAQMSFYGRFLPRPIPGRPAKR